MKTVPNDDTLVAYLDDELGPDERAAVETAIAGSLDVATRLEFLGRSSLPYAESFEHLLRQAPRQKLGDLLSEIAPLAAPVAATSKVSRRSLIAAFGCLAAGVALDRAFLSVQQFTTPASGDMEADWRGEIAEYLALYTPETLQNMTIEEGKRVAQLQHASQRLGLQLNPFAMNLGGLEMRRTQVLEYAGKPLGQIMYLDPEHGPVALCIIASTAGHRKMRTEQRSGLNLVYWSSDSHAFVMAARNPIEDLHSRAEEIRYDLNDRNQV